MSRRGHAQIADGEHVTESDNVQSAIRVEPTLDRSEHAVDERHVLRGLALGSGEAHLAALLLGQRGPF